MSKAHRKFPVSEPIRSLEELSGKSSSNRQKSLFDAPSPGSLNDELMVRSVLTASIKQSGKSREIIADEMSELLGITVTARMITAFTAESKELHRWPGAWDRAFCHATGDGRLLTCRVRASGFRVIGADEEMLLELGREFLRQKRSASEIERLERSLQGVNVG